MSTTTVEYDPVNKPKHYNDHPSGVECIRVTRAMSFDLGNAFKYVFRHGGKGKPIEDLEKALFYIDDSVLQYTDEVRGHHQVGDYDRLEVSILVGRIVQAEPNENVGHVLRLLWNGEVTREAMYIRWARKYLIRELERLKTLEASDV